MQQREFQDVNKQAALKIPFNSEIQIVLINAMALGNFSCFQTLFLLLEDSWACALVPEIHCTSWPLR
eukprot:scaffold7494_cov113-Cylindrotheca_fusiformis.AAC.1